jgi:hypothetical protein
MKKTKLTLLERRKIARRILSWKNWVNVLFWEHRETTYDNLGIPKYVEDVELRITNL